MSPQATDAGGVEPQAIGAGDGPTRERPDRGRNWAAESPTGGVPTPTVMHGGDSGPETAQIRANPLNPASAVTWNVAVPFTPRMQWRNEPDTVAQPPARFVALVGVMETPFSPAVTLTSMFADS
jgi:hypothetical protein